MLLAVVCILLAGHIFEGTCAQPPKLYEAPNNPCIECEKLADRSIEEFTSFKFFKEFLRDNVTTPWKAAGIKSCDEFRWAYQCFQHCKEDLPVGFSYSYPPRYRHLEAVLSKFCEPQWTSDATVAPCRMADTRACDMLYNKRNCGRHLSDYVKCVDDVLATSQLNCDGVCTPARRFHKSLIFQWEMECKLKESADGRCGDYINLFCFGEMKDTDISFGVFDKLNENVLTQNLATFCPKLKAPLECLQSTVDTWLMYFGFNMTKPCRSVNNRIQELKTMWSDIIYPLCDGRPNGTIYIQDLCGSRPTTQRIPSTTTTPAPPTTPLKTMRIKRKKRRRKIGASSVALVVGHSASLVSVTLAMLYCHFQ